MKTIKRKKVLTIAATAILFLFAANVVNSQILVDYDNVAETVYQTAGKTFRLYVMPDLIYSPGYVAADNAPLGTNARWAWEWTLDAAAEGTKLAANENWVEITPAVGTYVFTVQETNTALACAADAGTTKTVEVIDAPTAQFTSTGDVNLCGDQPADNLVVTITENVPDALAAYAFRITKLVQTIDGAGDVTGTVTALTDHVNFPLGTKAKTGTTGFAFNAGGNHTYTIDTDALVLSGTSRTRYRYTLAAVAAGTDGNGLVSAISQKSDYVGVTVLGHAFGAATVIDFIVNPRPTTQPIYHIPNDTNI